MKLIKKTTFTNVIFTLVLLKLVYTQGAEIKNITENKINSLGSKIEFRCELDNAENYTLLWQKVSDNRQEQYLLAINETLLSPNERFTVKYDKKKSNYILKITDLESNDAGFYQCQISVDIYKKEIAEVKLDIEQPPKITNISRSSETIIEGGSITLYCLAKGQPVPKISWKRENDEILPFGNTMHSGDTLHIPSAQRVDHGIYYCIAENGVRSEVRKGIKVNVEFSPTADTPRPRVGQAKGFNANLQCHVQGNPIPKITWTKNGREISSAIPRSSTNEFVHSHYINLIGTSDYGFYSCIVQNKYGTSEAVIELFETEIPWTNSD